MKQENQNTIYEVWQHHHNGRCSLAFRCFTKEKALQRLVNLKQEYPEREFQIHEVSY